jgi:hypothetical protein
MENFEVLRRLGEGGKYNFLLILSLFAVCISLLMEHGTCQAHMD